MLRCFVVQSICLRTMKLVPPLQVAAMASAYYPVEVNTNNHTLILAVCRMHERNSFVIFIILSCSACILVFLRHSQKMWFVGCCVYTSSLGRRWMSPITKLNADNLLDRWKGLTHLSIRLCLSCLNLVDETDMSSSEHVCHCGHSHFCSEHNFSFAICLNLLILIL